MSRLQIFGFAGGSVDFERVFNLCSTTPGIMVTIPGPANRQMASTENHGVT